MKSVFHKYDDARVTCPIGDFPVRGTPPVHLKGKTGMDVKLLKSSRCFCLLACLLESGGFGIPGVLLLMRMAFVRVN